MINYKSIVGEKIMSEEFDFKKYDFNAKGLSEIDDRFINWPIVYLINNEKEVYIGETSNIKDRMNQHLKNPERKFLKIINLIFDEQFNKSAILDIEQNLIRMFYADNKFNHDKGIQNKNSGQSSKHNYYQREKYLNKIEKIWKRLQDEELANKPYEDIINSNIYKYSPFVSLTAEQEEIMCKIINNILDCLEGKSDNQTSIITGLAGTGKTILAVNLIYNIVRANFNDIDTFKDEEDDEETLSEYQITMHRLRKYIDGGKNKIKIGFVVPMRSLRKTLDVVLKSINKKQLKNIVIGPRDVTKNDYDVIICDETHRLATYKNRADRGYFKQTCEELGIDEKTSTQLDWINMKSKYKVLFYDGNQTIKGSDISKDKMNKIIEENKDKLYNLTTQLRCKSGELFITDVDKLFECSLEKKMKSSKDFEIKLFDDPNEMIKQIKKLDKEFHLCRTVAGYDWEWKTNPRSKKFKKLSKEEKEKLLKEGDIELEGKKYIWNHTTEGWILSSGAVDEIGCVHTVQGYDLNYVGVIIGKDLSYNKKENKIDVHIDKLKDTNVKNATDKETVQEYIINTYKVLLERGIRGCYVYAHDESMQKYLSKYIEKYDKKEKTIGITYKTKDSEDEDEDETDLLKVAEDIKKYKHK